MRQTFLPALWLRRPIKSAKNSTAATSVYLLICKKCLIQYVVKTVYEFHYRWNNYKNSSRN